MHYWCLFLLYPVAVTPYGYASKFDIHFDDKFDVSFGREGETMSLGCRVVITPEIKPFQPEVQWYRNGEFLNWVLPLLPKERCSLLPRASVACKLRTFSDVLSV